jgi:penicillin amidase
LFPGQLGGLDEALLRKVQAPQPYVPEALKWPAGLPCFTASNNWAIAPHKSATGHALLANDPHLEINRLPPVWYPVVLRWHAGRGSRYAMGGTVPGVPAVVAGRTPDLAWGVTYAMADCVDSWIEECRDGRYRRAGGWVPFRVRKEVIRRKRKPPLEITFSETEHGLLAGEPREAGFHLATRWSCGDATSASSVEAALAMLSASSVEEGRRVVGRLNNSCWNWMLADRDGNIGYQMSGKMPLRREGVSGLVPLPGWDPANDWRGFAEPHDLPRELNPPTGLLVTANDDLNPLGKVRPINVPMAAYRAERIADVLRRSTPVTIEQTQRLQLDLRSTQAERLLALLKPLLSRRVAAGHANARRLLEWDCSYDLASGGAGLFERFYRALIEEVFGGEGGFGRDVIRYLLDDTALFIGFFGNFDRVMLAERSAWFGQRTREEIYASALDKALGAPAEPYGQTRQVTMKHLLLGGKLPRWLGFDRGPIALAGSRATVSQGQIFRSARRESTFGPSLRLVTDLGTDELHLAMPGGASDRRWSRWYNNLTSGLLAGRFHLLRGNQVRHPA